LWQGIAESLFEFVFYNVLSENIKKGGSAYFPIILTIFIYILSCNLIGMIPYSLGNFVFDQETMLAINVI